MVVAQGTGFRCVGELRGKVGSLLTIIIGVLCHLKLMNKQTQKDLLKPVIKYLVDVVHTFVGSQCCQIVISKSTETTLIEDKTIFVF